jgi:DNA replication and repair protein RecF
LGVQNAVVTSEHVPTQQYVARLTLTDFRCIRDLEIELGTGITVVQGNNGQGKTSLLEAIGWPARANSLRNVTDAAVVRSGCEVAILRSEIVDGDRHQSFEAEVRASGRNRMLVNRQPVQRIRDLHGLLRVTVFAPDDLQLVKGSPSLRRSYIDDLLEGLAPRYAAALHDFERILKQRNALLKQIARDRSAAATLGAFDEQLVGASAEIIRGRVRLLDRLRDPIVSHYEALGEGAAVEVLYRAEWDEDRILGVDDVETVTDRLWAALERRRSSEMDRQVGLVGPHRDDLALRIKGLEARTQASQGEQRSFALALRLAGHSVLTEILGTAPVLLLDDVFSELDVRRAGALVNLLPAGQTVLSSATDIPQDVNVERVLEMRDGRIVTT